MKLSAYLLAICTIAYTAPCATEGASPKLAQTSEGNTEKAERRATESPVVDRIDLSDRSDLKLEDDLKKAYQTTQPIIIDLTWSKVAGDLLRNLRGHKGLLELCLFGTDTSDKELRHLGELPNLESLDLGGCNVTTEGILRLRSSRKLKRLGLADLQQSINDTTIKRIVSAWPNLESISLNSGHITDVGLSHIGKLRRLRYLNISRTQITDKGLESLAGLSQLTTLHAGNTNILDQGMVHLGVLTSLEKLDLNFTGISDRGLKEVCGLTNLKRIYFVGTKVTDNGLEFLEPLKTIEYVGPSEHISPGALENLKKSLPLFKKNKRG